MKKFDRTPQIVVPAGYEPESAIVMMGGHEVTVYKMSLNSFARCTKIAEPYIKEIANSIFGTAAFQASLKGEKVDPKIVETEIRDAAMGKLTAMIADYPPEKVAEMTWVPAEQIVEAARLYATSKPAALLSHMGPTMQTNVIQTSRMFSLLIAITGTR